MRQESEYHPLFLKPHQHYKCPCYKSRDPFDRLRSSVWFISGVPYLLEFLLRYTLLSLDFTLALSLEQQDANASPQ